MSSLPPPHDNDNDHDHDNDEEDPDTRVTCDVLCSLGGSLAAAATAPAGPASVASTTSSSHNHHHHNMDAASTTSSSARKSSSRSCPKQHQLPMFLSKTYHMIDRCDPAIATWSVAGDNFVVKDVEQFSAQVLPLYFKHSNFSSFARQLNFYGFRKLRTDPILTSDVDPSTACYVRFYHEKFQKDQPQLLHQIKRATKSDPHSSSKDDVESLKSEITRLKDCVSHMSHDMDRKLAEMSYEYNRRITSLSAEYDKLAGLVTQILASSAGTGLVSSGGENATTTTMNRIAAPITATTIVAGGGGNSSTTNSIATGAEMMQSLSHVAALRGAMAAAAGAGSLVDASTTNATAGQKRMAPDTSSSSSANNTHEGTSSSRPKMG